jgi:hypothetical protein
MLLAVCMTRPSNPPRPISRSPKRQPHSSLRAPKPAQGSDPHASPCPESKPPAAAAHASRGPLYSAANSPSTNHLRVGYPLTPCSSARAFSSVASTWRGGVCVWRVFGCGCQMLRIMVVRVCAVCCVCAAARPIDPTRRRLRFHPNGRRPPTLPNTMPGSSRSEVAAWAYAGTRFCGPRGRVKDGEGGRSKASEGRHWVEFSFSVAA